MRKTVIAIAAFFGLMAVPMIASAASVTVQNYFYAHANTAGSFVFKDKYGSTAIYGDGIERDASIVSIDIEAEGMAAGDTIVATSSGGGSWTVTPDTIVPVTIGPSETLTITLNKTGNNEVWARLDVMRTFDASNGGTDVTYYYSRNDMPSYYGDLGPGSGNVGTVNGDYNYLPEMDLYQYLYEKPTGVTRYELHYLDSNGATLYKRDYEQAPTGIHYLTCNGTYQMRFYNGAQLVAQSPTMQTTQLVNPTCSSFSGDGGGFHDFQITVTPTPGVDYYKNVVWDVVPGAASYKVYKDGSHWADIPGNQPGFSTPQPGHYTVIALDSNGQPIAQADTSISADDPDPGNGSSCDGCQFLTDMLACPAWDEYMGDLTQAIKDALPPPPDWPSIADVFVDKFADYFGDVPQVPSKQEIGNNITPPIPPLNTAVPEADIDLEVPHDYDEPIDFDITTGPQIAIEDESEPIEILEPGAFIDSDPPGVFVYPGDDRNDSQGIKEPNSVTTDYPQPTPTIDEGGGEVPPTEMPVPSGGESTMPTPTDPGGIIPIPRDAGGGQ